MKAKTFEKISVLMPAYNEGRHIYQNLEETRRALAEFSSDYEIIVVDDGSRDRTLSEIKRAAEKIGELKYFSYPENRGKGQALIKAFQLSHGDLIFFLDSDLDIHPRQFESLLRVERETGADVTIGSKRHPQSTLRYPATRRIISATYFFLIKIIFGLPLRDTQTGIKLFRRGVLENILPRIMVKKYAFDLEVLVNAHHQGFRIAEAPVVVDYHGKFGRIGVGSIVTMLVDTLAVFYRQKILKYYDRPLQFGGEKPAVSIVIPFSRPGPYLEECLSRIRLLKYPDYEVILLPDEMIADAGEGIRVIPTGPISPPLKRDRGWQEASGEIIAFLDDDAYPRQDWLEKGVRHFGDRRIAAVGGPGSTPPDDNFRQQAGGRILSSWMVGGVHIYRTIPKMLKEVDDYPTFNLLVRRSVLKEIGGFQSPYWPGEDTVLCLKITRDLGRKIIYDPEAMVWHHRRPLFGKHLRQIGNYGLHRGYFVKRFPETSLRLNYFLPSLWTLFLLLGWIPLLLVGGGIQLYLITLALYLLAAFFTGVRGGGFKMTIVVMAGIISTHVVYGLNFIRGLLIRKLPEERKIE